MGFWIAPTYDADTILSTFTYFRVSGVRNAGVTRFVELTPLG